MDHDEATRKIGALKAIIQSLTPKYNWGLGSGDAMANFYEAVATHDVIASAIANELTESEIDHAFGWNAQAQGGPEAEMRAHPLVPYLRPAQGPTASGPSLRPSSEGDRSQGLTLPMQSR